jgi:hypothetical protein
MWVAIYHAPSKPLSVYILTDSSAWRKIHSGYYIFHLPSQFFTVVSNVDIEPPDCSSSSVCSLVCSATCAVVLTISYLKCCLYLYIIPILDQKEIRN